MVAEKRRQAFDAYERTGLPHRRIEDWKYTDLRVLMREVLPLAPRRMPRRVKNAEAALKRHKVRGTRRLVLVDGTFAPELSDTAIWKRVLLSARCARCWKPAMPRCRRSCSRPTFPTRWWR